MISSVAGDIVSINDMAATMTRVYGVQPALKHLGSLDELRTKMLEERKKYGSDFYKYVF